MPRRQRLILAAVVMAAFFGSLILLSGQGMFVSPDENANAFFARTFAHTGALTAFEPMNLAFDDLIVPRSVVSLNGFMAPGGFVGLPAIYGAILRVFGDGSLLLITPLLAALAVFAWYGVVSRTFGRSIGFVSALLFAILPGWWYYSARSLMPSVPFVAFLLFGAYLLFARPIATRIVRLKPFAPDALLAGACVATALSIRASEAAWLMAASLAAAWVLRRSLDCRMVAMFFVGAVAAAMPFLFLNAQTYGSPFSIGYTASVPSSGAAQEILLPASTPQSAGPVVEVWARVQEIAKPLFPFGLHPRNVIRNVTSHGLTLFWWMTLLAIGGVVMLARDRSVPADERRRRLAYDVFAIVAAAWLAVMYGSWNIHDNPDPNAVSIGNSYVRYWLPAFVLGTPYAAAALTWIARRPVTVPGRCTLIAVLALISVSLSVHAAYYPKHDGLVSTAATLRRSAEIKRELLMRIETDAVVVVDRGDKLLFPDRRVRYPLRDETTYALMPRLARQGPLYYYGLTLPEGDLTHLNDVILAPRNLHVELVKTFDAESLYQVWSF